MSNLTPKAKNVSEPDTILSQLRHFDIRQFIFSDFLLLSVFTCQKKRKSVWARECRSVGIVCVSSVCAVSRCDRCVRWVPGGSILYAGAGLWSFWCVHRGALKQLLRHLEYTLGALLDRGIPRLTLGDFWVAAGAHNPLSESITRSCYRQDHITPHAWLITGPLK